MPENHTPDKSHPRVLIATNALTGGGAQRSNLQIALRLAQNGFPTSVLTVRPHDNQDVVELDPSTTVYGVSEARWPRWTRAPHVLRHVLRVVRDEDIDLVISGSFGLNQILLGARALRMLRSPLIVVEHLGIEFRLDVLSRSKPFVARLFRHALTLLYRYANRVVAVSHGVAQELEQVLALPSNAVTTIYNGIDTEAIRSKSSERPNIPFAEEYEALPRPIVISAGRLEPQKAYEDLVRAFAQLPDAFRGSLVILGDGSQRAMLTDLASSLRIDADVHLQGHVANPWWFIAQSDVFALSSRFEGLPLVLIEALACDVPIVSTDCPSGPREILGNAARSRLVPISDPKSLRNGILEILGASNAGVMEWTERSPAADKIQAFSPQSNSARFVQLVAAVMKEQ